MLVSFTLNGDPVEVALKTADRLLVDVLREDLRMTGTKHGCGIGACGTCTVIMDGEPIASCLQLAALCEGADVRTIEGLAGTHALHAVQQAFVNKAAFQCGICTPGHVMAACALLDKNPQPREEEIRDKRGQRVLPLHGIRADRGGCTGKRLASRRRPDESA